MPTGSRTHPARIGFPATRTLLMAGSLMVCATVILIFFSFDPARVPIFPPCVFHELTGLDCPGCGAQRALHQLLHGNILAAVRLNAMFVISLPLAAWFGTGWLLRTSRGETFSLNSKWLWLYLAAWLVFGVLRNLPFPIFQWFAA